MKNKAAVKRKPKRANPTKPGAYFCVVIDEYGDSYYDIVTFQCGRWQCNPSYRVMSWGHPPKNLTLCPLSKAG
jgi:hypothetical protein